MSDEHMNVRETAKRLGVHENTVRNWHARGLLSAVVLPGSGYRRFSRKDVERMRAEMWSQFAPATEHGVPREARGEVLPDDAWDAPSLPIPKGKK